MKWWQWACAGMIFSVFVSLSWLSAKQESRTYDEIVYAEEGRAILAHHDFSIDPYNPPFIKELMVPFGRSTTTAFGVLLLLAVFLVTKSYFGISSALFALFLLTFEPNILGNSHYITLDVGFTLFFFLSYILFLEMLYRPHVTYAVFLGLALGSVLASKISAIPYFFSSVMLVGRPKYFLFSLGIALFVLWGTYFFRSDVVLVKHDNPNRVSNRLLSYASAYHIAPMTWAIGRLQNQKVPLGRYIGVIKNTVIRSRASENTVRWYAMMHAILLKTPVPLLLFFFFSLRKKSYVFAVPIGIILVISSLSRMSPWVRYVLPIYPFMVIIAASSVKKLRGTFLKLLFIVLVSWYAIGTVRQFPHFISYANELAGPREKRYEKFVDSNIDWGQGLISLQQYISIQKPRKLLFSYFGRDNADLYGFVGDKPWGGYKFEDICAFHTIDFPKNNGHSLTAISISNWYYCGYVRQEQYIAKHIIAVVGDSILIFTY